MTARVRRNSIHVEKTTNWKGDVVWAWGCDEHPRSRGIHHTNRWIDQWRKAQGLPPDTHPWVRAHRGADRHYHRDHAACPCHTKEK